MLVHCSKVRNPAEDFDYFLLVCQTRSSLRSLSLFSPVFFCHLFLLSFFFSLLFSLLLPLLFVLARFVHVVISSLLTSILPPFPPMVAKSRHTPIIHRSQSEVRGQRELARVLLTSVCVLVGTMMVMGLLFYFIQTQTRLYAFLVYALLT